MKVLCWMVILIYVCLSLIMVYKGLWHSLPMRWNPKEQPGVTWSKVLQECKTGDLILFSGYSADSAIVRAWGWSDITHVGIVVRVDEGTWLIEANLDDTKPDALNGNDTRGPQGGVQLTDLEVSLKAYDGLVFWRPLKKEIDPTLLLEHLVAHCDSTFNTNSLDLLFCCTENNLVARLACVLFGGSGGAAKVDRRFCSEIVALLLLKCHVISPPKGSSRQWAARVHPQQFFPACPSEVPWLHDYKPAKAFRVICPHGSVVRAFGC